MKVRQRGQIFLFYTSSTAEKLLLLFFSLSFFLSFFWSLRVVPEIRTIYSQVGCNSFNLLFGMVRCCRINDDCLNANQREKKRQRMCISSSLNSYYKRGKILHFTLSSLNGCAHFVSAARNGLCYVFHCVKYNARNVSPCVYASGIVKSKVELFFF